MFIQLNRKGQSTLEYAVIIGVVVTALLAINIYMKRGVEGKLRSSTDQIGEQFDVKKSTVVTRQDDTGKSLEITSGGATTTRDQEGVTGSAPRITKSYSIETVDKEK